MKKIREFTKIEQGNNPGGVIRLMQVMTQARTEYVTHFIPKHDAEDPTFSPDGQGLWGHYFDSMADAYDDFEERLARGY